MTMSKYELRDLTADDTFPMCEIVSKIGMDELKELLQNQQFKKTAVAMASGAVADTDTEAENLGLSFALSLLQIVLRNMSKCRDDIYQLLSGLSGLTKQDIAKLPMRDYIGMLKDTLTKAEFRDFFTDVVELLK